jgi:hypothetical protein
MPLPVACNTSAGYGLQVQQDEYSKLDKTLLEFIEDVLLNRREDSTERLLDYAATLDPKSKPTAVKLLTDSAPAANIPPKVLPLLGLVFRSLLRLLWEASLGGA